MRKLWECKDWSVFINVNRRKGIRLRFDEEKMERQAKYYASEILYDYAETRDHP